MGKYMRKARVTGGDVAVMEVPTDDKADYLQLRSRRLEKTHLASSKETSKGGSFSSRKPRRSPSYNEDSLPSQRDTRETTPCSLICSSEAATMTPKSAGKLVSLRLPKDTGCKSIPCRKELEEFFQEAEQLQQKLFMEKYNFDPVNDCPFVGRYEWLKLDSS